MRSISSECGKTREGLIADIITRPDDRDAIHALIFAALDYLKDEGCSIVRCCLSHKGVQKILTGCGFIKRKPQMRFLINKNINTRFVEIKKRLTRWKGNGFNSNNLYIKRLYV